MLNLTNYLEGCKFYDFKYWFVYNGDGSYSTVDISSGKVVGFMFVRDSSGYSEYVRTEESGDISNDEAIMNNWNMFKLRPEYLVGNILPVEMGEDELYDKLLIGCIMLKYARGTNYESYSNSDYDPDTCTRNVHAAINWLRTTDFYTAPASSRYHDKHSGGLVTHSLNVVRRIVELSVNPKFRSVNIEDAIFVALIHDWCKIGLYESYMRNVKDESGKWVQRAEFKYRDKSLTCFGHGVSSMFLAQKFFRLSLSEAVAIRWHMGFCRVADSDMDELQQANETYPLVHMLQFADQLSIVEY